MKVINLCDYIVDGRYIDELKIENLDLEDLLIKLYGIILMVN